MSILIDATDSFYRTQDKVVFSAQKSENVQRKAEDFSLGQNLHSKVKFFSDGEEQSLDLNGESLSLLREHFDENDFLRLRDGSLALSGKVAAFVDGWYKDIMQNRDFLLADRDKNGRVEGAEHLALKNSVKDRAENQDLSRSYEAVVLRMAKDTQGYVENQASRQSLSVSDLLNESIKSDKNFDGQITRLEYAAKGGSDMDGYTNWAVDALDEVLDEDEKRKKIHLIIDPSGETFKLWGMMGATLEEVKAHYDGLNFGQSISRNGLSDLVIDTPKIKEIEKDLSLQKQQLLNEFPEFKALIQSNINITKEQLQNLKNKQKISQNYQSHQGQNLQEKLSQNFFKTNIQA